jgi:hypothetical protein
MRGDYDWQVQEAEFYARMTDHARQAPDVNVRFSWVNYFTSKVTHHVRNADLLQGTETAPKVYVPSWMDGWTFEVSEDLDAAQCERLAQSSAYVAESVREGREVWTNSDAPWQTYMRRAQHMTVKYAERAQQLKG